MKMPEANTELGSEDFHRCVFLAMGGVVAGELSQSEQLDWSNGFLTKIWHTTKPDGLRVMSSRFIKWFLLEELAQYDTDPAAILLHERFARSSLEHTTGAWMDMRAKYARLVRAANKSVETAQKAKPLVGWEARTMLMSLQCSRLAALSIYECTEQGLYEAYAGLVFPRRNAERLKFRRQRISEIKEKAAIDPVLFQLLIVSGKALMESSQHMDLYGIERFYKYFICAPIAVSSAATAAGHKAFSLAMANGMTEETAIPEARQAETDAYKRYAEKLDQLLLRQLDS
jgi:hypothetical protein